MSHASPPLAPESSAGLARRTRLADRLVIHGAPMEFGELLRRAVPPDARYLVLDLDRTVHLGRNMGELLGWEVAAYHAYGRDALAAAEPRRRPGRFFLDRTRPLALLRYLAIGLRMWALPGLFYLLCGKLAASIDLLRRWSFRTFGSEPVAAVQRVPQTALLHHLAEIPAADLRVLARRVWDRHRGDQVIDRADLDALRARCPGIRIVIASASPQPTLEVAAEALGADDVIYSSVEEHDGWFSAPFQPPLALLRTPAPRRISGPDATRINSSRAKIANLWARWPDLADPRTVSVGVTDTGYGEDHCWLDHFTRVVDVNSSSPFPPIVDARSPVEEIHSAAALTRAERERRAGGDPRWLDPRRPPRGAEDREFRASDLGERLAAIADEVERLARARAARALDLAPARERLQARFEALTGRIEALVGAFNAAAGAERARQLAALRRELRANRALQRELARVERPLSEVAFTVHGLLARARRLLGDRPGRTA